MNPPYPMPQKWLKFFVIIILTLGIFFRFASLNQKVYWEDETYTSLWLAGYDDKITTELAYNNQQITIDDLHKYQQIKSDKNINDTLNILKKRSEHPPIYYVLARFWAQGFGASVTAMRTFPALISLFIFPCIYWLCLELFEYSTVGWLAMALVAVSPFFVRYAQEVRQYSLWAVMILLSSTLLLRAIRIKTKLAWIAYAAIMALSFYSHLFSILVLTSHGIYLIILQRFRLNKTFIAYSLASIFAILSFTPWVGFILRNRAFDVMEWIKLPLPFLSLLKKWSLNLCHLFISWNYEYDNLLIYLSVPVLILVIYSIYFLCRHTEERVWLFILTLIGVTALAFVLPDLISGGRRSTVDRYFTPCYLGLEIAVAYLLASQLSSLNISLQRVKLWQLATSLLISAGVLSCAIDSQAQTWWGKDKFIVDMSRVINQASSPIIISDARLGQVMPLSYRLDPKVRLLLFVQPNVPKIPDGYSDVFLFNPSKKFIADLHQEQNIKIDSIYQTDISLWRLKKI